MTPPAREAGCRAPRCGAERSGGEAGSHGSPKVAPPDRGQVVPAPRPSGCLICVIGILRDNAPPARRFARPAWGAGRGGAAPAPRTWSLPLGGRRQHSRRCDRTVRSVCPSHVEVHVSCVRNKRRRETWTRGPLGGRRAGGVPAGGPFIPPLCKRPLKVTPIPDVFFQLFLRNEAERGTAPEPGSRAGAPGGWGGRGAGAQGLGAWRLLPGEAERAPRESDLCV